MNIPFYYKARFKVFVSVFGSILLSLPTYAQDSTKKQSVVITSAYKPVLKPSSKLQFTASPPAPDGKLPALNYLLPVQNITIRLQPFALKPIALPADSLQIVRNNNYIKLGYGNYNTPFAEAGFTQGTPGKALFNLFVNHLSQTGPLRAQKFGNTALLASVNTIKNNLELYAQAGYQRQHFYLYGPDPLLAGSKMDSLKKPYQLFTVKTGFRNAVPDENGITYNPEIHVQALNDLRSTEWNTAIDVPLSIRFNDQLNFTIRANADLTWFQPVAHQSYTNHLFFIQPSFTFKNEQVKLLAGLRPTWDQGVTHVLPDLQLDFFFSEYKTTVTGGITGRIQKNNYLSLSRQNPWIEQPLQQINTKVIEAFGGIKGMVVKGLSYRLQVGYAEFSEMPLFRNVIRPSVFDLVYEDKLGSIHTQAELGFVLQDKLTATAQLDWYNYFSQQSEKNAWHLIPLQFNTSLHWKPIKKLIVHSDLFLWQGPLYLKSLPDQEGRLPAVADLNIGAEVHLVKNLSVWLQMNNLLNQTYQRWNNYQQLGFQVLGGIKLTFDQKQ
jgi:hypothetical protein